MHKHDPVPPLPDDVPRPVADLVYAMLAKEAERTARVGPARGRPRRGDPRGPQPGRLRDGPSTADLPVVPNFPPATSNDLYQNGRPPKTCGEAGRTARRITATC
jgi:hypothetical protein